MSNEWIRIYNDYSCVDSDDIPDIICHYTTYESGVNIIKSEVLWASKLQNFFDQDEGALGLKLLNEYRVELLENDQINNLIGNKAKIKKFVAMHPVYTICFSKNTNNNYMVQSFNSNNTSKGRSFEIDFNRKRLMDHIYYNKALDDESKKFRLATIHYNESECEAIIQTESKKLSSALEKSDFKKDYQYRADLLARKMFYIGTRFKKPHREENGTLISKSENEVRLMLNTIYDPKTNLVISFQRK